MSIELDKKNLERLENFVSKGKKECPEKDCDGEMEKMEDEDKYKCNKCGKKLDEEEMEDED